MAYYTRPVLNAPLKPVRDSWATAKTLLWNIVNAVPDHVFFQHGAHVRKGIGWATYASFVCSTSLRGLRENSLKKGLRNLVRFHCQPTFTHGQFITLKREDVLVRSYLIASSRNDNHHCNIHVRKIKGGRLSSRFHGRVDLGTRL